MQAQHLQVILSVLAEKAAIFLVTLQDVVLKIKVVVLLLMAVSEHGIVLMHAVLLVVATVHQVVTFQAVAQQVLRLVAVALNAIAADAAPAVL